VLSVCIIRVGYLLCVMILCFECVCMCVYCMLVAWCEYMACGVLCYVYYVCGACGMLCVYDVR